MSNQVTLADGMQTANVSDLAEETQMVLSQLNRLV